jgi:short-subunit dehydrogenase
MSNAIVFGSSSGIGKELAIRLVKNNYHVVIIARRLELLKDLRSTNTKAFTIKHLDVQDLLKTESVFNEIVEEFKTIELVIHSSGIGYVNPKLSWQLEYDTLKTNVLAATKIYDLSYDLFKKQGFGHLVSITSVASLRGNRYSPAYFASKAFQVNYLESLYFKAKEINGGKIYTTDVRPGYVDTRMALGDDIFWMVPLKKAGDQIYSAIKRKKRRVYISKRWQIIAWVLKFVPSWIMKKVI